MTLSGAAFTRSRLGAAPTDSPSRVSREIAESTSIARGLLIGLGLGATVWAGIIGAIFAVIH